MLRVLDSFFNRFRKNKNIDNIVLVILNSYIDYAQNLVIKENFSKVKKIVAGGKSGQESIFNGLNALKDLADPEDFVFIHDAVRPFISCELIDNCIKTAQEKGNAVTAAKAIETVSVCDTTGKIRDITCRTNTWILKAPQVFRLRELLHFHDLSRVNEKQFIDSADMMHYYGKELNIVECDQSNIKITTPTDRLIAEIFLKKEK